MAGLKGTRFEDFILAAKKRAEDAIGQHKPRLTTLEKSLRDAAIRRRNNPPPQRITLRLSTCSACETTASMIQKTRMQPTNFDRLLRWGLTKKTQFPVQLFEQSQIGPWD